MRTSPPPVDVPGCRNIEKLPSWVHSVYAGAKSNSEAGVKSKFVGADPENAAYLVDPRAHAHSPTRTRARARALGWTSNTGNYFGKPARVHGRKATRKRASAHY